MKLDMYNYSGYRGDRSYEKMWGEEKHYIIPLSGLNLSVIPNLAQVKRLERISRQVDTLEKREPQLRDFLYQICQ